MTFAVDEHPRPQSTLEALGEARPGLQEGRRRHGGERVGDLRRRGVRSSSRREELRAEQGAHAARAARAVGRRGGGAAASWASAPRRPSSRALTRAALKLADMDLVEVNEAFAPQYLAVEKELGLDRAKTNVERGRDRARTSARRERRADHGAPGLRARAPRGRYAVGSACIGGGQGIAVLIERV